MSESPRLDRMEHVVIRLDADLKAMTTAVSTMAKAMQQLVEMQTDQKLLKQDMEHRCAVLNSRMDNIDVAITHQTTIQEVHSSNIKDIERAQQVNTIAASIAGKLAWAITSTVVTSAVALGFYFLK